MEMMRSGVPSQPTQAQTEDALTQNALSPPMHSQMSPSKIDDDQVPQSIVEDYQISQLLLPDGRFRPEGVPVDVSGGDH
jgi:hypothetical protein